MGDLPPTNSLKRSSAMRNPQGGFERHAPSPYTARRAARQGSSTTSSKTPSKHPISTVNNLSLVTGYYGIPAPQGMSYLESVICGHYFDPVVGAHMLTENGERKFTSVKEGNPLADMYIALHEAGTEFHCSGRVSTAVDIIEGVQGRFNMAIRDSLLSRHQAVVTIEASPESEFSRTLSTALDEHQIKYAKYYDHCANRDAHDEAWARTHTGNVVDYCESTNNLLKYLRTQPTSIEGGSQATSSGSQRPVLSRLQTSPTDRLSVASLGRPSPLTQAGTPVSEAQESRTVSPWE